MSQSPKLRKKWPAKNLVFLRLGLSVLVILQPVILLPYCMYCVQLPKYITITLHFVTTFNQDSGNHDISDGNVHITIRNRLFLSVMIMLMRRGFRESGFSILLGWLPCPKPGCCTQTCSLRFYKTKMKLLILKSWWKVPKTGKDSRYSCWNETPVWKKVGAGD